MLKIKKTRSFCILVAVCLLSGHPAASATGSLIVYEFSNPLLNDDSAAPSVHVSKTGHVTVFRPPGFKKPGSHEFVLSDSALVELFREVTSLNTEQEFSRTLTNIAEEQPTKNSKSHGVREQTIHNTDSTVATLSVNPVESNDEANAVQLANGISLSTTTFQVVQSAGSQLVLNSPYPLFEVEILTQKMQYLFRLPMNNTAINMEVDFEH